MSVYTLATHAFYNNEQALRVVVKAAYVLAADHYVKVDELPSGRGVADVVYLPKRGDPSSAGRITHRRPVLIRGAVCDNSDADVSLSTH